MKKNRSSASTIGVLLSTLVSYVRKYWVQMSFIRRILGMTEPYSWDRLKELKWYSQERRRKRDVVFCMCRKYYPSSYRISLVMQSKIISMLEKNFYVRYQPDKVCNSATEDHQDRHVWDSMYQAFHLSSKRASRHICRGHWWSHLTRKN